MTAIKLRPYQENAIRAIATSLQTVQKSGFIVPTGGGKTTIFVKISDLYLKHNPGQSVLILSHLSLLTNQTSERFATQAPHLKVGVFQADRSPASDCQVIIGTMQTSQSKDKTLDLKLLLKYPVGLIIVDEAHFLQTTSYEKAISYFPKAKVLGCTATPFRAGALMVNYFDDIAYSISMQELIDQGFLVPPRLIQVDLGHQETTVADRIATVARIYEEKEAGKSAIVFMNSIESAKEMRNVLQQRGFKARAVTSELVGEEREKILGDFRSGNIQVLTTVNVLTAGFDSPNVEAIFMPFATQSPVTYLQRIGRGLRPCEENQKKDCRIYVCGDTPSIKRELFQKLHNVVLETGGEKKKSTTFQDDLEYNDYEKSSEVYLWTATVVSTIEKMEKLGMPRLSKMLNEKNFPKKFLRNIATLRENLPSEAERLPGGDYAATDKQRKVLLDAGFSMAQLHGVTKNEASAMVATLMTTKSKSVGQSFVIPLASKSKFGGMHISKTTWYYRKAVLEKNPNGTIATMIKEWEKQGGRYD